MAAIDKSVIVRFVVAICFIVGVTCVFLGREWCHTLKKGTKIDDWKCGGRIDPDQWDDIDGFKAQYFVATFSLLFAVLLIVLGWFKFTNRTNIPKIGNLAILGLAAAVAVCCAGIEIWLGTGKYKYLGLIEEKNFIQSYLAAAAFYILAAILSLVDLVFTVKS